MRCPLLKLTMNKLDFLQVLYVHQCSLLLNWFSMVWDILLPAFNICPYFVFFDCNWKPPGSDSSLKVPHFLWLQDEIVLIATFTKEEWTPCNSSTFYRQMNELTEQNISTSKKIQISIREYSQKKKIESTLRAETEKSFFINLVHWIREQKWWHYESHR